MDTRFGIGQVVRATTTAQGLIQGVMYEVVETLIASLPFGNFVTYCVTPVDGGERLSIVNGHLLLTTV